MAEETKYLYIKFRHTSYPDTDYYVYPPIIYEGQTEEESKNWSMFMEKNPQFTLTNKSLFTCVEGDIIFDVDFNLLKNEQTILLWIRPLTNKRMIDGTLRITSGKDSKCFVEKTIYGSQNNFLGVDGSEQVVWVYEGCDEDCNYRDQYSFKAIKFEIDENNTWIECISAYCFEPYLDVSVMHDTTGYYLNIRCKSALDLYQMPVYVCGYDKCGELIAEFEFVITVLHSNEIYYNDSTSDEDRAKLWDSYKLDSKCQDGYCSRYGHEVGKDDGTTEGGNNGNEGGDGGDGGGDGEPGENPNTPMPKLENPDTPPNNWDPNEGNYTCTLELSPTKITIDNDKKEKLLDKTSSERVAPISCKVYSNNPTKSSFKVNDTTIITKENWPTNGLYIGFYDPTDFIKAWLEELSEKEDSNAYSSTSLNFVLEGGCKAESKTEIEVTLSSAEEEKNEPDLTVKMEQDGEMQEIEDLTVLMFTDDTSKSFADCGDPLVLNYLTQYTFTVEYGTSSWFIYSYSNDVVSCIKNSDDTFTVRLLNYDYISCDLDDRVRPYIKLRNTANMIKTFYIAVDNGLVLEDEYRFDWGTERTEEEEYTILVKNYENYFSNDTSKDEEDKQIYLHSVSNLVRNIDLEGNEHWFFEDWSFSYKVVDYKIERYNGTKWEKISSFKLDGIETNKDGAIRVFIYKAENPRKNDILITTSNTYKIETTGYIDFIQNNSDYMLRLAIKHPPVIIYDIYTDQKGAVKVKRT